MGWKRHHVLTGAKDLIKTQKQLFKSGPKKIKEDPLSLRSPSSPPLPPHTPGGMLRRAGQRDPLLITLV